jgi:ElaB/YqjD/DUF883 family membrane-anchored ribosome-binding protein
MDTRHEEKQNFKAEEHGDKPTDEALEQVQDQIERLIGQVQEKYDIGREQAIQEAERLVSEYNVKLQAVKDKAVERVEQKTAQSPWKVIALALASGFVLGFLLRPQSGCDRTE